MSWSNRALRIGPVQTSEVSEDFRGLAHLGYPMAPTSRK